MIDRIRWIIGKKKPVEWDITNLTAVYGSWFPAMAKFTFRPGTSQEFTLHFGGFWEEESFLVLRSLSDVPIMMPIFVGDPIEIDGDEYIVEFVERTTLGPSRLCSIWAGFIGFSWDGYEVMRYKLN